MFSAENNKGLSSTTLFFVLSKLNDIVAFSFFYKYLSLITQKQ